MGSASPYSRKLAETRVGRTLKNKWTIDVLIDVGGMASVYAATHRNGKRVAIKILHPIFPSDLNVRERFLREGYLANKVDHPGAVSVLDDDVTDDDEVFLVMELLEGASYEQLLRAHGNVLPSAHVLAIVDQVLEVLAAAHAKSIVHRDIKPANLFVTRDRQVKVLDFGLARLLEGGGNRLTGSGIVVGTAAYMAPEQARTMGQQVDGRTDLYAVGAVMYRSLTGRFVHDADTMRDQVMQAMNVPVLSLGIVAPDTPEAMVAVVDKALAFERDQRWADALTMQKAVRHALAQVSGEPMTPIPSVRELALVPSHEIHVSYSADVSRPSQLGPEDILTVPSGFLGRLPEVSAILMDEALSRCDEAWAAERAGKER